MTSPASTPAAEATARMVVRSYPAAKKARAAASRMRASVRRRCSAREPGGILVQLLAFRRPDLVAGLVLADPGHEEMEGLLPSPIRCGWRIMRTVFPDELHDDAPVTLAAIREMRAAAMPFYHRLTRQARGAAKTGRLPRRILAQ